MRNFVYKGHGDTRTRKPNPVKWGLVLAAIYAAVLGLAWLNLQQHRPVQPPPVVTPVPPLAPTPYVPDTGWHMALDYNERTYTIPLRYDQMNDVQRDDVNRFGREYPGGN